MSQIWRTSGWCRFSTWKLISQLMITCAMMMNQTIFRISISIWKSDTIVRLPVQTLFHLRIEVAKSKPRG